MRFDEHILYNNGSAIIKIFHSTVSPMKRLYNEHHHTECELSLFISGSGTYKTRKNEYSFTEGDIFLFGSNEAHCITEIYNETTLLNIHFEPRILWENSENSVLLSLFTSQNKNFKNLFPKNDTILKNTILNIEHELKYKKIGYHMQVKNNLLSALLHILREYNYFTTTTFSNFTATQNIDKAISYIEQNLEKKLTLKEISNIAGMSQTYFSSIFKKFNGISPWDYITIKRVEMAITLLKTTNMSKLEIAEKCGFSSHANFYKLFKKITGKTPTDYVEK